MNSQVVYGYSMKVCAFLTAKCPHKCKFCGVKKNLKRYREATPDQWKEVIDAVKPSFFIFFGGEPLLYDGWEEIADYLKEKGIDYTIFTTTMSVDHPMTVSVDTEGDKRSEFGKLMAARHNDVVVNSQIMNTNLDDILEYLESIKSPWLVDFHHCGRRKDGKEYILRTPDITDAKLSTYDLLYLKSYFEQNFEFSLERPEVYQAVLDALLYGWYCTPEEHVGYLTIAPDTSLMCCVDLPLGKTLYAKDWPNNKKEYIEARVKMRDTVCTGCAWRHEISASLRLVDDWSTEGMFNAKKV